MDCEGSRGNGEGCHDRHAHLGETYEEPGKKSFWGGGGGAETLASSTLDCATMSQEQN